nr:MAG TPA: hypothetical protein [Caudoviricetes sp.]
MAHAYVLTFKLKNVTDILFFIFMSPFTTPAPRRHK